MMLTKINILGHEYEVIHDPHWNKKQNAHAACCCNVLTIELDSSLKHSLKQEAVLHEVIEALNFHLETKLEHGKITQIGLGLFQVLKQNPDLRKFLDE